MPLDSAFFGVACNGVGSGDTSDDLFRFGVPALFRAGSSRLLARPSAFSVDPSMVELFVSWCQGLQQ